MMDTIFTVHNEDLARLNSDQAVHCFRELLWAEATATGIGKNLISVPSAITVADGGIDAEVADADPKGGQGLIKKGLTRYQIKTGSFSLQGGAHVKHILFRESTLELKPRIKSCLDADGTLVAVLFGSDNPEADDNHTKQQFVQVLRTVDEKYADAKIEIWRQNNLRGFMSQFPSLALRVTGKDQTGFQSHHSWSLQDDMLKEFTEGESQRELIETLRAKLRNAVSTTHVRLWGEPGIGKTRLALEATRSDDLAPLVVYCDAATKFRDGNLMNELLKEDNTFSVILVIDECDPDARSYIWNKFKHYGSRIKLVSLYGEYDPTSGDIAYLQAPLLEKGQVGSILQGYNLPKDQAERWSDLCSGSPRVAHVIGSNLMNNPEDLLKPLDSVNVWARYVEGSDPPDGDSVRHRTTVLRYMALFKRFGYGNPLASEAGAVAALVQNADPSITWPRFQEVVKHLRNRRILQGENTLCVTPRALHLWLWREWWNTYGDSFDYMEFSKQLPPQLLEWFNDMFRYAYGSPATSKVVEHLLGPSGPFKDGNFLQTEVGGHFFLRLSEADPKAALAYLKRTIGTWEKERLLEFTEGRREVVWALENIAVWKELFYDAALLLLALGEAENELRYSNNASGVFTGLFAVGPGPVASTEAAAAERFPILKNALLSPSSERRRLAISACSVALESGHWFRMAGHENQGVRQGANLWVPKEVGEMWDAYRRVWEMLLEVMDEFPDDDQSQVLEVLLGRARGLTTIPNLSEMVLQGIRNLIAKPHVENARILAKVIHILHYEGQNLEEGARGEWGLIRDELVGNDFSSLMKRYVGMDLLEDHFDEQGNHIDQVQARLEELAQQSIDDADVLLNEIGWLVTNEAPNGFRFGYELGKRDAEAKLLPQLLEAQEGYGPGGTLYFVGGYLRAYREIDEEGWEKQVDSLAANAQRRAWVPELTLRSGLLSDRAAKRVLDLIQSKALPTTQLKIFVFGGVTLGVTQEVFQQWIQHLLSDAGDEAVAIALDLYAMYYRNRVPRILLPKGLTLKLLTHDSLFQSGQIGRFHNQVHNWTAIGEGFLRDHPGDSLAVAEQMLHHLGEEGTIVEGFHSDARPILNKIAQRFPNEVWHMVAKSLGPPIDVLAFTIKEWLRGEDLFRAGEASMIEVFPVNKIWEWVDGDPETRAWYLATFVPPTLLEQEDKTCVARELLIRYGARGDVRINLEANFSTEGWTGPMSVHLQAKKAELLEIRVAEVDPNIIQWIDGYVEYLDAQMGQAHIEEEREQS